MEVSEGSQQLVELLRIEHDQLLTLHELKNARADSEVRLQDQLESRNLFDRYLPLFPVHRTKREHIKFLEERMSELQDMVQMEQKSLRPITEEVRAKLRAELARTSASYKMGSKIQEIQQTALQKLPELDVSLSRSVHMIGAARTAMVVSYNQGTKGFSSAALNRFKEIEYGVRLIGELIREFNELTRTHNLVVVDNQYREILLPSLEIVAHQSELKQLPRMGIAIADQTMQKLADYLEAVRTDSLTAAGVEVENAIQQTERILQALVTSLWYEKRKQFVVGEKHVELGEYSWAI